jgi:hypothetical protein
LAVTRRLIYNNMLTTEENQHKDEIIDLTEQVLNTKGLAMKQRKISKLSEEDEDGAKKEVLYVK